jgi:putative spermidine/putrescine transport system permease protein
VSAQKSYGVESRGMRFAVRISAWAVLAFMYVPLIVIALYAFSASKGQSWPIEGWTLRWFGEAWRNPDIRTGLGNSLRAGLGATAVAFVLGSIAAFAVHRFKFFGRDAFSMMLVLPIALPGIVTGIALASAINYGNQLFGLNFGMFTIIVSHATFCIVLVYNNVIARLRRTSMSLIEASQDLGADGWQTFRYVWWPSLRTAMVAGCLLAFALSFDEIIVTNFTSGNVLTLPKWIYNNLRLPNQRPQVNVVAFVMMVLSFVPVYIAQRLTRDKT